jgi:hypothetical protein
MHPDLGGLDSIAEIVVLVDCEMETAVRKAEIYDPARAVRSPVSIHRRFPHDSYEYRPRRTRGQGNRGGRQAR